jgi:hypothetical protein
MPRALTSLARSRVHATQAGQVTVFLAATLTSALLTWITATQTPTAATPSDPSHAHATSATRAAV